MGNNAKLLQVGIVPRLCFLQETLRTQNQHQAKFCAFLEVEHWYRSVGCARNKLFFRSSTESEIISVDAGLRMDGLPALDLWDIVIEVLRSTKNNVQPKHASHQETGKVLDSKTKTQHIGCSKSVVFFAVSGGYPWRPLFFPLSCFDFFVFFDSFLSFFCLRFLTLRKKKVLYIRAGQR